MANHKPLVVHSGTVKEILADGTLDINGHILIEGVGRRITGDFSNVTMANRVMFQTSTANTDSTVGVIPNGSGGSARFNAYNLSTPDNAGYISMSIDSVYTYIDSGKLGTGSYLPLAIYTGGAERMRIDASGNVGIGITNPSYKFVVSNAGAEGLEIGPGALSGRVLMQAYNRSGAVYSVLDVYAAGMEMRMPYSIGYGAGAGGTVTQATNKSTAVTLNKPSGQITMNSAALAAGAAVQFAFNNSLLTTSDVVIANIQGGVASALDYLVHILPGGAGIAQVVLINRSAGSLSNAVVINFAIIKGSTT